MQKSLRPPDRPLAWMGEDRLLLDDRTRYGLRRKVYARKSDLPNMVIYLQAAFEQAGDADVRYWMVERDDFWYLWIVWKDKRK